MNIALLLGGVTLPVVNAADLEIEMSATTTGPPWPPSEVVDVNGDFIAIGSILEELPPGGNCFGDPTAFACFGPPRADIVSKETVPPLDGNGDENYNNDLFGAAHTVVRTLDLSEGSPDLDMVLYTSSFGPSSSPNFKGGPRIPAEGDSTYNLNSLPSTCPELFPTSAQDIAYTRDTFPLHQAPIWGFEGDGVEYDVTSGASIPTSPFPFPGSNYEFSRDTRPTSDPITFGDWMKADKRSKLKVTLIDHNAQGIPTAAKFILNLKDLMPNSVYTVWGIRVNTLLPANASPIGKISLPGPLCYPNVLSTDDKGRGKLECKVENPFRAVDGSLNGLLRLVGVTVAYHPSNQNWGGCFARYGVGVDHTVHVTTGLTAFDSLFTVAKE